MIDLGYNVNFITVISNKIIKDGRKKLYLCSCKCGNVKYIAETTLKSKRIRDCDCGNIFERHLYKITSNVIYKNGCSFCTSKKYCEENNIPYTKKCPLGISRIKRIFKGMLDRCYNPNAKDYKWYGAKGIIIDEIWLQNKNNFINWALANGYRDDLTIDRIDGDGNYEPSNCRWVDIKTQQNNRKNNVKFLYEGEMLSINEISKIIKINSNTLRSRLRRGVTLEEAIKKPVSKRR